MMKTLFARLGPGIALVLLLVSCREPPDAAPSADPATQSFVVRGVIREIQPDGKTARVQHEEIPNFMAAMTMPIVASNPRELEGLQPGDPISFRLVVTEDDAWMEQITKLDQSPFEMPSRHGVKRVRQIEDLNVGDLLPDHRFTDELGRTVSLADFRGNALALTFIFTSCPMPTICPRMSRNFAQAQEKLSAKPGAPDNWRLLSISIDPEVDTPPRMRAYAQAYQYDPERWSFLTGDPLMTRTFGEMLSLYFWREDNTINHNLQTVVVNRDGRIQTILPGNDWTPDELVEELIKAAK